MDTTKKDSTMDTTKPSQMNGNSLVDSVNPVNTANDSVNPVNTTNTNMNMKTSVTLQVTPSNTPQSAKRSRRFSQISSPILSPVDLAANPPSEARMVQILAEALKPLQEKLDDLIENQVQMDEQSAYFHTSVNELNSKHNEMQARIVELERENKDLRERVIHQESQSRRNNLRFHGLIEGNFDNAEEKVLKFLQSHGLNFHPRSIERAHRIGAFAKDKTRPIIVRFLHYKDREVVWRKLGHRLIPPNFNKPHVREDFPKEIDENRSLLLPVAVAATKTEDPSTQTPLKVKLVVDSLYINNQRYTKNSMSSLPSRLHPRNIYTPTAGNKTAFFTRNSPFSNHFPSPFKINGESFNCLEQFLMVEKARTFDDQEAVHKIMAEKLPAKQKQAGKSIKGFDKHVWEQVAENKVFSGLLAKFEQNPICKDMLIDTANNIIIEANPYDKFWGAGVSLYSADLWNINQHPGKNIMGKLLVRVREHLSSNEMEH